MHSCFRATQSSCSVRGRLRCCFSVRTTLSAPSLLLLGGCGHCGQPKNGFLSGKRNKVCFWQQSLLCREVFYRETRDNPTADGCRLSLYTVQFSCTRLDLARVPFDETLEPEANKNFCTSFCSSNRLGVSIVLWLWVKTFTLSCASALAFNRSLKSTRVGRLQAFLTVCIN